MKKNKIKLICCFSSIILLGIIFFIQANGSVWIEKNIMDWRERGVVGHYEFALAGAGNTYLDRSVLNNGHKTGDPVRLSNDYGGRISEIIDETDWKLEDEVFSHYYGASGNSSSSVLSKPSSNAEIIKAYLVEETIVETYTSDRLARLPMTLKGPKGGSINSVPLFNMIYMGYKPSEDHVYGTKPSVIVSDVTSFVQEQGFGTYEGWDIPYWIKGKWHGGTDQSASWKLVVICEDENLPLRMLSLKMGAISLQNDYTQLVLEGSGIKTKESGNVTGQLLIGGVGGDPNQVTTRMSLSPDGNEFINLNTGFDGQTNTTEGFFQGIFTINGVPRSDIKSLGTVYRNNTSYPYHNNDFILLDVNNAQNNAQNGHNAYFKNNSDKIILRGINEETSSTVTVLGMTVDIDVATYKSSISHTGQAWQNIPLQMSAHLQNNTNTSKTNIGVSGGYATIKIDSNIKLDSKSVVATFFDKSSNQKITLPSNMISVNGNTITVKYGKDSNAISQVGDTLDVSFKGTPSKTGSYTNSISMYANGIVDENGYSHVQNNTFYLTSSKDTFTTKYNNPPTISATNKTFYEGEYTATYWKDTLRWQGVKASDKEDGTYTKNQIKIVSDNVNVNKQGTYKVVYSVTDSVGQKATATSTVTVKYNNPPVITAYDQTFYEGQYTDSYWKNTLRWKNVSASDVEDGNITSKIQITSDNVNVNKPGVYSVTYKVTDKFGKSATKTVKVTVKYNNPPTIKAEDRWFYVSEDVNETRLKEYVTAKDIEDGVYTDKARIKIISNNVRNHVIGDYKVTYKITDNYGKSAQTTANIHIVKDIPTGDEVSTYLRFIDKKYLNTLKSNSLWRTTQSSLLNNALNKTEDSQAKQHWHLSNDDIERIKRFNDTHDWSEESNKQFLEEFADLLQ